MTDPTDPTVPRSPLRNPVTLAGAVLTTVSALLFLTVMLADLFGLHTNPYLGILFFIVFPAVFVAGLALIPLGLWRERRRRLRGLPPSLQTWPRLDFSRSRVRRVAFAVLVLTPANLLIVGMAGVRGIEYMDSPQFCGQVCHEVMEPEYVAYQAGAHARVACVDCHIGPGAGWFVKSKLSGARQVVAVLLNSHGRPIPTPVHDLRPSRDTCEQCHWPAKFHGDKVELFKEYAEDEANTESVTTVQLHIGGTDPAGVARGIHWHVAEENVVEYVPADDARQTIPYVKHTAADGTVTEYFAEGVTGAPAGESRRMDCVDCHNRPSHTFARSAERAINQALAAGAAPIDLPFLKREAVRLLKAEYPSQADGLATIPGQLQAFYRESYPELWTSRRQDVDRAAATVAELYRRNVFPSMKVSWGQHADNRGHMEFPGCFRCHDDGHVARDGRKIRQDCDLCHDVS
jgi:hypothetical protein